MARATAAGDWNESGACVNQDITELTLGTCTTNSATPGLINSSQSAALMRCPVIEPGCGNGIVDVGEDCEVDAHCPAGWVCRSCACTLAGLCGNGVINIGEQCDDGPANSDLPDANCRTDCTPQRCGDGITDPASGEICETNAECTLGQGCYQCGCRGPLGSLTFTVAPGVMGNCPADDGAASFLKVGPPLAGVCNGTNGDFNPAQYVFNAGPPGPDGLADLEMTGGPVVVGGSLPDPGITIEGYACFEIRPDPARMGFIDCNGGSSANASLSINSNGANADDPPVLVVGGDGANSGAGAALIPILLRAVTTASDSQNCSMADFSASPQLATVLTTATATATISNTFQGGSAVASLTGRPFNCDNWTANSGASIVVPNANTDVMVPILGRYDIAQALRLKDN